GAGRLTAAAATRTGRRCRRRTLMEPPSLSAAGTFLTLAETDTRTITRKGHNIPSFEGLSRAVVKHVGGGADLLGMSAATSAASVPALGDDELIELSRASASRPLAQRSSTAFLATGFVVVALLMLSLPSQRATSLIALAVCVGCYALACRVRFEFGGVFAVPTQPVFVAMWFLLPPRLLPLAVCGSMLLAELPDFLPRRTPRHHV